MLYVINTHKNVYDKFIWDLVSYMSLGSLAVNIIIIILLFVLWEYNIILYGLHPV